MNLNFEKDNTGWYIILPSWKGPRSSLAMVAGADTLLDELSNNGNYISLDISLEHKENYLHLNKINNCWFNGADYIVPSSGKKVWLCNVTKFVFGNFPKDIYVKVSA